MTQLQATLFSSAPRSEALLSRARARTATCAPGSGLAAAAAGRRFTQATLSAWGVPDCDDITLAVSEMLTNALQHAAGAAPGAWPVRLGLLQSPAGLLCAVADPSPAPPRPCPPGQLAECGRGLHVVQELSDAWGFTDVPGRGKVVWATFAGQSDGPGARLSRRTATGSGRPAPCRPRRAARRRPCRPG